MLDVLTSNEVAKSKKSRLETPDNSKSTEATPPAQQEKLAPSNQRKYQVKGSQENKKQYRAKTSIVSLDYLEGCLQLMFKERTNTQIESRVRFKIQDLIDKFEREWKHEIFFLRRNEIDSDGF